MSKEGNPEIIHFQSWEQIFRDEADAARQYEDFLDGFREEYGSNDTLKEELTQTNPDTNLSVTVFIRMGMPPGYSTRIQKLPNGNVHIVYVRPDPIFNRVQLVTPDAGNRNHHWNYDKICQLRSDIEALGLVQLDISLKRKPATAGWEKIMLDSNHFSQRVGYRIYPDNMLERAKAAIDNAQPTA